MIRNRHYRITESNQSHLSPPPEQYMTNTPSTHHKTKRTAVFIATAAAALLATTPFASAKKPDPAVAAAVGSALSSDIEQAVIISLGVADQIGAGTIKLSTTNVNALVKGVADAIVAKIPNAADPINPNRIVNKVDEIGEVAAAVTASVLNNPKIAKPNLGQAKKYSLAIMKSALKTAVASSDFLGTSVIASVVSAVALTIHADPAYDSIEAKLAQVLAKQSKKIAGKANAATVSSALAAGFAADPLTTTTIEDGNIRTLFTITDPETDFRNS
jgi:hypothetical protein